ncbi:serum amyloid P-component-like [Chanos chanos]|uniref:Pentraxin family member n=1 Tax=Chanos chanos TaxID=29144 RepID=A0A6J2VAE7_CHACN|nr:serum amyloid P-component-like [Chanos chanos]
MNQQHNNNPVFTPHDLTGKVFTFPMESNQAYVTLTPNVERIFFHLSVCLRFFSDMQRAQSLFSLSVPTHVDALLLMKSNDFYSVSVNNVIAKFWGLDNKPNVWNSACFTWDAGTGLTQLWINGNPSARKGIDPGGSILGTPKIILGQDQDIYGGGFHISETFVGMLSDVHMWDRVLTPTEILNYSNRAIFPPGNILNWGSLEYTRVHYVVVESHQFSGSARDSDYGLEVAYLRQF